MYGRKFCARLGFRACTDIGDAHAKETRYEPNSTSAASKVQRAGTIPAVPLIPTPWMIVVPSWIYGDKRVCVGLQAKKKTQKKAPPLRIPENSLVERAVRSANPQSKLELQTRHCFRLMEWYQQKNIL
jgi:hypothetical protein